MERSALAARVKEIRWFHQIDLGDGVVTPGFDRSPDKIRLVGIPERLDGLTVLDIGAWDGVVSFECERRGARRVLATDRFAWHNARWSGKRGFLLAREALDSRVEDLDIDVMELSPERVGTFDVVLFLGVLYHLPNPVEALRRVASVCSRLLILETEVDLLWFRRPAVAFHLDQKLRADATNECAPNIAWLQQTLRSHGFADVRVHRRYSMLRRAARAAKWAWSFGDPLLGGLQRGRVTVHASRAPA